MTTKTQNHKEKFISDIVSLKNYAVTKGIQIPEDLPAINNEVPQGNLVNTYNKLNQAIKPATLESINFVNKEILNADHSHWFKISLFTKSIVLALISLLLIIGISLSPSVNVENQAQGLLSASGLPLFLNLVFILASSLLGVMFYLLKTTSEKIKNMTLLPDDMKINNANILIGVMSGFIISELFAFNLSNATSSIQFQKMTLALLGGFSSDAIFSILKGVVDKIKLLTTSTT